jgi:serine/threonine-protein kinase
MAQTFSPGQVIGGRYKIIKQLGQGGFGTVYLAEDIRLAGRRVALKVSFDVSPDATAQFQTEAEILARLRHPGLASASDRFEERQHQFLVMDFIEGQDLTDIILNKTASEQQLIQWMLEVCDAVAYLHSQTPPIIHRDIKPPNIKIKPDGHAVLVDFGIAKLDDPQKRTVMAAKGASSGFSPPEQYTGRTDTRSDVYSLGATLYCALTSQLPMESIDRLTDQTSLEPRRYNPVLSPVVEQIILKAMALSPADRFQSAREMRLALASASSTAPVAQPASQQFIPPALPISGLICQSCGRSARPIAKFCSYCGVPLVPPSSPETLGRKRVRPPILGPLTIPLVCSLEQAKSELFANSRNAKVQSIINSVLNVSPNSVGLTFILHGLKGFGGTLLATRIRDSIQQSKGANLVAYIILPDKAPGESWASIVEDIIAAFERGSGNINQKLQGAVSKYYTKYVSDPAYFQAERDNQSEVELSFPEISLFGTALKIGRIKITKGIKSKPIVVPMDEKQRSQKLLNALSELVNLLLKSKARVVLIIDKLVDIETLRPLKPIAATSNVVIVTIADKMQYERWKSKPEHADLLGYFDKTSEYFSCFWEMPRLLCERLTEGRKEADDRVFRQFIKFLEFKGRGLPDLVVKTISKYYTNTQSARAQGWLPKIFQSKQGESFLLHVPVEDLPVIFACAEMEESLSKNCPRILASPAGIRIMGREQVDIAKVATYATMDWLLQESQKGAQYDLPNIVDHATNHLGLPTTQKWVVENAVRIFQQEDLCFFDSDDRVCFAAMSNRRDD